MRNSKRKNYKVFVINICKVRFFRKRFLYRVYIVIKYILLELNLENFLFLNIYKLKR